MKATRLWLLLLLGLPIEVHGHGGPALASKGATVDGNRVYLTPAARGSLAVKTARVTLSDLRQTISVNASLQLPWRQQASVSSPVTGRIERLLVRPGDLVEEGQELLTINSQEFQSLQVELLQAEQELGLTNRLLDQSDNLVRRGVLPEKSLLEARLNQNLHAAEAGILTRKLLTLGLTSKTIEEVRRTSSPQATLTLYSPRRGQISHVDAGVGERVEPSQELLRLVDVSRLWAVGELLEHDALQVAAGMPAELEIAGGEDQRLSTAIERVGLKVEGGAVSVYARVENADGQLRPGTFGRLRIETRRASQAVACPREALLRRGSQMFVLLEDLPNTFELLPVTVGLRDGGLVEIEDGLFPGDEVVIVGQQSLASLIDVTQAAANSRGVGVQAVAHQTEVAAATRNASVFGRIELPGDRRVLATATTDGTVATVLVEAGQDVQAGQKLMELASPRLASDQLDLLLARAKLDWLDQTVGRLKKLNEQRVGAQKELWRLESDQAAARHTIAGLRQKLLRLGLTASQLEALEHVEVTQTPSSDDIGRTATLVAPASGRIVAWNVSPGEPLEAGHPVCEIHDAATVWARTQLSSEQASRVKPQQEAMVLSADGRWRVVGKVARVAPQLSSRDRLTTVWVEVDNPELALKEGMLVRVEFASAKEERVARGAAN